MVVGRLVRNSWRCSCRFGYFSCLAASGQCQIRAPFTPGPNPMNGLQACEYECFLKPLVVACAAKIDPLTLEFTCK